MTPTYPEPQHRRPDFDAGGYPVRLADGQSWTFPRIRLFAAFDAAAPEGHEWSYLTDEGAEYAALLEAVEEPGAANFVGRVFRAAWHLLSRQYDLPAAASKALLRIRGFDVNDPDSRRMVDELVQVVQGIPPKAA